MHSCSFCAPPSRASTSKQLCVHFTSFVSHSFQKCTILYSSFFSLPISLGLLIYSTVFSVLVSLRPVIYSSFSFCQFLQGWGYILHFSFSLCLIADVLLYSSFFFLPILFKANPVLLGGWLAANFSMSRVFIKYEVTPSIFHLSVSLSLSICVC